MNTSKQLKDLINNKAKECNLNPQILLTRFFMERFLERIFLSKYKNNFILKGGILISSMLGVDFRMTKDLDLTIKKLPLNEVYIKKGVHNFLGYLTLYNQLVYNNIRRHPHERMNNYICQIRAIKTLVLKPYMN